VAQYADIAVVTSDNPRTEEPGAIIEDILKGIPDGTSVHVEADRRRAIDFAVRTSTAEDVILIAGKGHEDYQVIGSERIHFDDREEARAALDGLAIAEGS